MFPGRSSSSFRPHFPAILTRPRFLFRGSFPSERNVWVVKFPFSAFGGFVRRRERHGTKQKNGIMEGGKEKERNSWEERGDQGQRTSEIFNIAGSGWKSGLPYLSRPLSLCSPRPAAQCPPFLFLLATVVLNVVWFISGKADVAPPLSRSATSLRFLRFFLPHGAYFVVPRSCYIIFCSEKSRSCRRLHNWKVISLNTVDEEILPGKTSQTISQILCGLSVKFRHFQGPLN